MVRSCDEKRGRKLHEMNYDVRGQRTPQSRTTEEAMVDMIQQDAPIKERTYMVTERSGEEGSEWPPLWEGLIQSGGV